MRWCRWCMILCRWCRLCMQNPSMHPLLLPLSPLPSHPSPLTPHLSPHLTQHLSPLTSLTPYLFSHLTQHLSPLYWGLQRCTKVEHLKVSPIHAYTKPVGPY
ncbi:hypothetical protein B484DRAFT_54392 [Ochromonadaceae sp. CCMP2298]|nr:hypothetical protein B484DRAFT_54392 [Ochromonadaceae sp. CCMP2298]